MAQSAEAPLAWASPESQRYFPTLSTDGAGHRPGYYMNMQGVQRITIDPEVMGGKPCIRGMRVTVGMVVESMAAGRTVEQLLEDFPYLEEADIRAALAFAAQLAQGHDIALAS